MQKNIMTIDNGSIVQKKNSEATMSSAERLHFLYRTHSRLIVVECEMFVHPSFFEHSLSMEIFLFYGRWKTTRAA